MENNKETLCYAMRHLYKKSLISLRDGNVSFREKNSNNFLITPGGIKKDNISQDQIIDAELKTKYPYYLPLNNNSLNVSREIGFHSRILKDEQDDCFIVHCHPKNTIAFMGLIENNELSNVKKTFPELQVKIGKNVLNLKAGSDDLANSVYKNINNVDIVGLKNHGVVSKGKTLSKALENIETIEYYCEIMNISKY